MIRLAVCRCGHYDVVTVDRCVNCGKPMRELELEARGVILTWTVLYNVPEGLPRPLHLTLVELANGMKMLCRGSQETQGVGRAVRVREETGVFVCEAVNRWQEFRRKVNNAAEAFRKVIESRGSQSMEQTRRNSHHEKPAVKENLKPRS